jgi:hypothetical protein
MNSLVPIAQPDYYSMSRLDRDDDRVRNLKTAKEVLVEFERIAENGGTLDLEIDRYGHVKMKVVLYK